MMRRSTVAVTRTSLPRRFESCWPRRSRSSFDISTAVVTVARTRAAARSARCSNSSRIPASRSTCPASINIRIKFVASGSRNRGAEISSMRCEAGMVGLTSTASTTGSPTRSRIALRCRCHSSMRPSSVASSNTALAYRLAAAVATRNLLDGSLDQLLVLRRIKRLADDLLCGGHHQPRDLCLHRLDGFEALGLDLFPRGFEETPGLVLSLLLELLPELLRRFVCCLNDALCGLSRVVQLGLGFLEPLLGRGAFLLGFAQQVGNLALPRLRQPHDLRKYIAGEDGQHHEECDHLDDHRPVDVDYACRACEKCHLLGGYLADEHEPEREVDEVHRFDEAHDREEPGDHAALCLGLAGDAADECVAGQAVTDGGANRA